MGSKSKNSSERPPASQTPKKAKVTPLPKLQLSILSVVLLTESICSTVLIPFVPEFVAYLMQWDIKKVGFASGFLVGLFMLGQVISSRMWSAISDACGRKVAITMGVLGCAVCMLLFGLSTDIKAACICRFLHGLSAGCSIVAKTMISDITDSTNQAKGLALVSLTWGVGTLIGPSIGGYLYNPAKEGSAMSWMHLSPDGFFATHPALLPGLVVASYNLFAACVSIFFLKESHRAARPLRECVPTCVSSVIGPLLDMIQPKLPSQATTDVVVLPEEMQEEGNEPNPEARDTVIPKAGHHKGDVSEEGAVESAHSVTSEHARGAARREKFGFKQAFRYPPTRDVCIVAMLISASDMLYAEILPLWCAAHRSEGGLSLEPASIAKLILVNSGPAIVANIFFSKVIDCFGGLILYWQVSQCMYAFLTVLIPMASKLTVPYDFYYTMLVGMMRKVWECWCFGLIMVIVARTAPPGRIGVMYGIQQATGCMVRAIAPFIGAPLFSWSISTYRPFPFNHYLVFLLCVFPLVGGAWYAQRIHIPLPSDEAQGSDASEGEEEGEGGWGRAGGERHSGSGGSAHDSARSRYSFLGSVRAERKEDVVLLQQSFATLAGSFATNIVPGLVQPTIIPPHIESGMFIGDPVDSQATYAAEDGDDDDVDSRDAPSQVGDEIDQEGIDEEYGDMDMSEMDLGAGDGMDHGREREGRRLSQRQREEEEEDDLPV